MSETKVRLSSNLSHTLGTVLIIFYVTRSHLVAQMWADCERRGLCGPVEQYLPKPPRVVSGFRRLRLGRLLDQLSPHDVSL
eukprot:3993357-Amphidinium_carterae.1